MKKVAPPDFPALIVKARMALGLNQTDFGKIVLTTRKTVGRWEAGFTAPPADCLRDIAMRVYAVDPELARALVESDGHTLHGLGIAPPPAPPVSDVLLDAIVYAAAEAADATPRVMRPAVLAAFKRARAAGVSVDAVVRALSADAAPSAKAKK